MSNAPVLIEQLRAFATEPTATAERLAPRRHFAQLWSLMFLASMACAMVTATALFFVDGGGHQIGGFINSLPAWKVFAYAVVFGPLVEELAFRLPLRVGRYALSYGLAFLAIFVFVMFFQRGYDLPAWLFDYVDWRGLLSWMVVSTAIATVFLGAFQTPSVLAGVQGFLRAHYRTWFYAFLVLFGAIHLFNFEQIGSYWFIAPLFILPQLSLAFFVGFARVRMGFRWAYLAHVLNNAASIGLLLAVKAISPTIVEVMSSFELTRLQYLPLADLLLFGLLNIVFFGLLCGAFYYASLSVVAYLRTRDYAPVKRLKIARVLSALLPGLGQDYLGRAAQARLHYGLMAAAMVTWVVPVVIPYTYTSLDAALAMLAGPMLAYAALTYYSMRAIGRGGERAEGEGVGRELAID